MKIIKITLEQNIEIIERAFQYGYQTSRDYIKLVYHGEKSLYRTREGYTITFERDEDATWFLLNI